METITIPMEEYNRLVTRSIKLFYLEDGGVDNWEWYDDCMTKYYEENEDD